MSKSVNALQVADECNRLVSSLRLAEQYGAGGELEAQKHHRHNALVPLDCLKHLLGDDPEAIVDSCGKSLATRYLRELWWLVPNEQLPDSIPNSQRLAELARWAELVRKAATGEVKKATEEKPTGGKSKGRKPPAKPDEDAELLAEFEAAQEDNGDLAEAQFARDKKMKPGTARAALERARKAREERTAKQQAIRNRRLRE